MRGKKVFLYDKQMRVFLLIGAILSASILLIDLIYNGFKDYMVLGFLAVCMMIYCSFAKTKLTEFI